MNGRQPIVNIDDLRGSMIKYDNADEMMNGRQPIVHIDDLRGSLMNYDNADEMMIMMCSVT